MYNSQFHLSFIPFTELQSTKFMYSTIGDTKTSHMSRVRDNCMYCIIAHWRLQIVIYSIETNKLPVNYSCRNTYH